jgi:hypothetical protein
MKEPIFIKKSDIECYSFANINNSTCWAKIFVFQEDQMAASIIVRSDYGHWSTYFDGCGNVKEFLLENQAYHNLYAIMDRFAKCETRWFSQDEIVERMRSQLGDLLEEGDISKDYYKQALSELDHLNEECSSENEDQLMSNLAQPEYKKLWCRFVTIGTIPECNPHSILLRRFMKEAWPLFLGELQKELKTQNITA